MAALVWAGIGLFLAVLLTISWWYDRDARRRGATPSSAGSMVRASRQSRWAARRQESQLLFGGATPRTMDGLRDAQDGRSGPEQHRP